jgi:transposase-like protein
MVAIIREADRDPVAAVAKRHGISEQTIYTWRKRFGGLQASDVKRLPIASPSRPGCIGGTLRLRNSPYG